MHERERAQLSSEERLEYDRVRFTSAAKAPVEEIDMTFDPESVHALERDLNRSRILLLGEVHGVRENTALINALFKKFHFTWLGLEWNPELRQPVERFLLRGNVDTERITAGAQCSESSDGRVTAGHFALLRTLHLEGRLHGFILFDRPGSRWHSLLRRAPDVAWEVRSSNERDARMARAIMEGMRERLTNERLLVVAGRTHAAVTPNVERGVAFHPMGFHIASTIPDVPVAEICPLSGHFFNEGVRTFREHSKESATRTASFSRTHSGTYRIELPVAHAAVVPNSTERPAAKESFLP